MPAEEIEDRIHAFKRGNFDILLTTTIIENGVNFLRANTIIIIDPGHFWLASLHQLRGRVGRKDQQGYCYLMYRKSTLGDDEKRRLITIANNNHLGAGFEIAMRDMEIRWAGDILGIAQSGKSKEVGLPLYFRMLEEKISELKQHKKQKIQTKVELDLSYVINDKNFLSELDKLNFFREIESIDSLDELNHIEDEMMHSENPDPHIENLILLIKARLIFWEYKALKLSKNGKYFVFDFAANTRSEVIKKFLDTFGKKIEIILVSFEKLRIERKQFKDTKDFLKKIISHHK